MYLKMVKKNLMLVSNLETNIKRKKKRLFCGLIVGLTSPKRIKGGSN